MKVILIMSMFSVIFWAGFEQAGGLLNIYANEKVNLALPLIGSSVPASWFQSVNAFFIIVFGTSVAAFWVNRARKGKEVSSLFKMAVGTIIMGSGFLMMAGAATEAGSMPFGKSAMFWLVLAYLLHTIGELCASPVALSFITKLAPVKYASIMMGVYFAATGLGNKVAGLVGAMSEGAGEFQVFTGIAVFCTLFGVLILLILKPLKRLTHGAENIQGTSNEEAEGFELADNN